MAITKTLITGTSPDAQNAEVLAWLQANATDYFSTIELDSSDTSKIMCYVGSDLALRISLKANEVPYMDMYLKNGTHQHLSMATSGFNYIISTPNGIVLVYTYNSYLNYIFITKNNNGTLFFAVMQRGGSSSQYLYTADFINSTTITTLLSGSNVFSNNMTYPAQLTALTPLSVTDAEVYSPNLYRMIYCNYAGTEAKLVIGNNEYYSNGYLALKG